MAFKDYLNALARGGLPEVLDTGINGTRQGDARPEKTAPTGTNKDRESFAADPGASLGAAVKQYAPLLLMGAIVIVTGVVVFRVVKR